jgi:hypothetical protein
MSYEERRVVTDEEVVERPVRREVIDDTPGTVVEHRSPRRTVVTNEDPVGNAYAASQLIQTIVWSVVVIVLLIVALWALHVYAGLF